MILTARKLLHSLLLSFYVAIISVDARALSGPAPATAAPPTGTANADAQARATAQSITSGQLQATTCSNGKTVANAACCALFPSIPIIQDFFQGSPCSSPAHRIIHIAFHDAMGFSNTQNIGGGADGSILTFDVETTQYPINANLRNMTIALQAFSGSSGISDGDFLHFAAAIALSTCPGTPQIPFFLGRPRASGPASSSNPGVPNPTDSAATIIARFQDVGLNASELIALTGAHSIGAGYFPGAVKAPFDSTPGLFDSQFYLEMLLPGSFGNTSNPGVLLAPESGECRLQSDLALANNAATSCIWQSFIGNQASFTNKFAAAMSKLQLLGQNIATMTNCSDVVPVPPSLPGTATPHLPAGFNRNQLSNPCSTATILALSTDTGTTTTVNPDLCHGYGPMCWDRPSDVPPVPTATPVVQTKTDIALILPMLTQLNSSLASLTASQTAAQNAESMILSLFPVFQNVGNDLKTISLPAGMFDTEAIMAQLLALTPTSLSILKQLTVKESVFNQFGLAPAIGSVLSSINNGIATILGNIFNDASPESAPTINDVLREIQAQLSQTLAVYPAAGASQCNAGTLQCCNSVQNANSPTLASLLPLLGITAGSVTGLVGVSCSPISVIGISGNSCSAQPVCCTNNSFNGLVALGCTPVNL